MIHSAPLSKKKITHSKATRAFGVLQDITAETCQMGSETWRVIRCDTLMACFSPISASALFNFLSTCHIATLQLHQSWGITCGKMLISTAKREKVQCNFMLLFLPERGQMGKRTYKKLWLALISTNHQMVRKFYFWVHWVLSKTFHVVCCLRTCKYWLKTLCINSFPCLAERLQADDPTAEQ